MMEENSILIDNSSEALEERYELCIDRIKEFPEALIDPTIKEYFARIKEITLLCDKVKKEGIKNAEMNSLLFGELETENFGHSYLEPDYCKQVFGEEKCNILCIWYQEFRGIISFIYENRMSDVVAIL